MTFIIPTHKKINNTFKSRMRQVGHTAYTGHKKCTQRFGCKTWRNRPLEDLNMKMGFKDIWSGRVYWIYLAQNKVPTTELLLAHQSKEFLQQLSNYQFLRHVSCSILVCQPIKTISIPIFRRVRKTVKSEY